MKPGSSRRRFLQAASALGGLSLGAVRQGLAATATATATAPEGDLLLSPGITYLNTATLGPTSREVLDRVVAAGRSVEENPVRRVWAADSAVAAQADDARRQAALLLGCDEDELLITRSATEAMNSVALSLDLQHGDRVLTTDQEHDGGSVGWRYLARRRGVEIDVVPITSSDGIVEPNDIVKRFARALTARTRVISFSHVITSTGLRMPVAEIAEMARRQGVLSIVDGAQAVGGIEVNLRALGCDAYATSGHKWLMGPKGTGLLFVRRESEEGIQLVQREEGRRFVVGSTGVGSLPLAVGLAWAVESMRGRGMALVERRTIALRDRAYAGLVEIAQSERGPIEIMSPPPGPLASALISFRLPADVDSHELRDALLARHGMVVKAVEKRWFNGIRVSPHWFNDEAEIDTLLRVLRETLT